MSEGDHIPIIIDVGSGICKAGFAGDDSPRVVFPSIVGHPIRKGLLGVGERGVYVGDEVEDKYENLKITYPVERGIIVDWDAMEKLLHHTFYKELRAAPDEHAVLITEGSLSKRANREQMAEVMFENFNTPALYIAVQAALSLYSSGRATGLVVDSGYGCTSAVPVYEGFALPYGIIRMELAGMDLTNYLMKILSARSRYAFTTKSERDFIRDIKEQQCCVVLDFEQEVINAAEKAAAIDDAAAKATAEVADAVSEAFIRKSTKPPKELQQQDINPLPQGHPTYKLPDEREIKIGDEVFRCPEALFQPSLLGSSVDSIQHIAYNAIMKCDLDIRKELYGNIVLAGGSSMFPGLTHRLSKELAALAPSDMEVKVIDSPERNFATWIGGSMAASMPSFEQLWITKEDYNEHGVEFIHRKCF